MSQNQQRVLFYLNWKKQHGKIQSILKYINIFGKVAIAKSSLRKHHNRQSIIIAYDTYTFGITQFKEIRKCQGISFTKIAIIQV